MDKKLLAILVCPTSRQPLDLLDAGRLAQLNAAIAGGGVRFGAEIFSGLALEARASYLVSEDRDDVVEGRVGDPLG